MCSVCVSCVGVGVDMGVLVRGWVWVCEYMAMVCGCGFGCGVVGMSSMVVYTLIASH